MTTYQRAKDQGRKTKEIKCWLSWKSWYIREENHSYRVKTYLNTHFAPITSEGIPSKEKKRNTNLLQREKKNKAKTS